MSGVAEKVPGWVERILLPTLETKVRSVVSEELAKFEKTVDARFDAIDARFEALDSKIDARFEAVDSKMDARFEAVNAKIDSLEKQFPTMKELAEIKARLSQIERANQ